MGQVVDQRQRAPVSLKTAVTYLYLLNTRYCSLLTEMGAPASIPTPSSPMPSEPQTPPPVVAQVEAPESPASPSRSQASAGTTAGEQVVKSAEFARLFDFFDSLAAYRARKPTRANESSADTYDEKASLKDSAEIPVPVEIVPMLQKLESVVANRTATAQGRGEAVDVKLNKISGEGEEDNKPNFPLGKEYPFTFKMMLHKLYELEEWAKKIQDEVQKSKTAFISLEDADSAVVEDAEEGPDSDSNDRKPGQVDGRVDFQSAMKSAGRVEQVVTTRPRRPSAATSPRPPRSGLLSSPPTTRAFSFASRPAPSLRQPLRSPRLPTSPTSPQANNFGPSAPAIGKPRVPEYTVVKKKRCVGRSKSISQLASIASLEAPKEGKAWVYKAAISSVEAQPEDVRRPPHEVTRPSTRADGAKRRTKRLSTPGRGARDTMEKEEAPLWVGQDGGNFRFTVARTATDVQ